MNDALKRAATAYARELIAEGLTDEQLGADDGPARYLRQEIDKHAEKFAPAMRAALLAFLDPEDEELRKLIALAIYTCPADQSGARETIGMLRETILNLPASGRQPEETK